MQCNRRCCKEKEQMMDRSYVPVLEHVKGDTWCIVTGFGLIPLYMADRQNAVLIDSGLGKNYREGILNLLKQEKIRIASILTSHIHPDHIGNHVVLRETHGCEICMSPYAAAMCRDPMNQRNGGFEAYLMRKNNPYHSVPADRIVGWDDGTVVAAGAEFKILQLPGHAPEQMGFVTPDNAAYLADTLLSEQLLKAIRIPYLAHCGTDLEAKATILNMNYDVYLLAHNEISTDVRKLAERNITNMHEKIDMVERLADRWLTLDQLTERVMAETDADTSSVRIILGTKRNVQLLMEYLQEHGRMDVRANNGTVEYIATAALETE